MRISFYEYGYSIGYYYNGNLELYNDKGELLRVPTTISKLFHNYFTEDFPDYDDYIRMELGKNLLKNYLKKIKQFDNNII